MENSDTHQKLLACLHDDAQRLRTFIAQLEEESRLLSVLTDIEALERITRNKERSAAEFSLADERREASLAACGLPSGHEGMRQAATLSFDMARACDTLQALARRASELNRDNGIFISACLQEYRAAVAEFALLEPAALAPHAVYDASGKMR